MHIIIYYMISFPIVILVYSPTTHQLPHGRHGVGQVSSSSSSASSFCTSWLMAPDDTCQRGRNGPLENGHFSEENYLVGGFNPSGKY